MTHPIDWPTVGPRLLEALERIIAWAPAVEVCAPELGGFQVAVYEARAALAALKEDRT